MLMIELYKIQNEFATPIIEAMFNRRNVTNNFRNVQEHQSERETTVFHGLETLSYRAPQLWTLFPKEI